MQNTKTKHYHSISCHNITTNHPYHQFGVQGEHALKETTQVNNVLLVNKHKINSKQCVFI